MNEEIDIWEDSSDFWTDNTEELTDDTVVIEQERNNYEDDDEEWFLDLMTDDSDDELTSTLKNDTYLSSWIPSKPVSKVSDTAKYAYNYLNNKGLPQHVSAGIVGNLMKESNLNPNIRDGDNRGGVGGIAQWDPSRSRDLINFSNQSGRPHTDLNTQLDFVIYEAQKRGDLDKTFQTKTPEEAAVVFGRSYERPNEKYADWNTRQSYAKGLTMQYGGVNNIPEVDLEGISDESIAEYLQQEGVEVNEGGNFANIASNVLGGIEKFNSIKNKFSNKASNIASQAIDATNEISGFNRNQLSLRKFNEMKNQKKYQLNKTITNNSPIYT